MIPKKMVQNSDSLRNAQWGFNPVRQAQSAVMRTSIRILRDPSRVGRRTLTAGSEGQQGLPSPSAQYEKRR